MRTPGSLGHAGYFAVFLLHGAFAGAALAMLDSERTWRAVGAVTTALAPAAIALSGTRSAIVGLVAGGVFLWIWFRPTIRPRNWVATAVLIAATTGFYFSPAGQMLRARTRWYVEDVTGGGRVWLWRDSARMGAAHWVTGWRLETFSSPYLQYQSLELAQAYPDRYYESAHNVFLDAWTSQGLPGLLALAGLAAAGGVAARRLRTSRSRLAGFLGAGLVATLFGGQFLAFTAVTKLYFCTQAGLLVALAVPPERSDRPGASHLWARAAWIAVACIPAWFAFSLARADYQLEQVRQAVHSERPQDAVAERRRLVALMPAGMYIDLWFSREMVAAAATTGSDDVRRDLWYDGKAAALRAAAHSETPHNAFYNLAFFYSQEGDVPGVEASLRQAIAASPRWYKPYWMLAQVLAASGERLEALPLADRAVELSGGRNEQVNAARRALGEPQTQGGPDSAEPLRSN